MRSSFPSVLFRASFPFTAMLSSSWYFFFKWYQSRMTVYGWNANISSILFFIFLAPSVKNTSLLRSRPLKIRKASMERIAFFIPHAVRTYASYPFWIFPVVFSSSSDIWLPIRSIQPERVRSFMVWLASRCWKRLSISAASL